MDQQHPQSQHPNGQQFDQYGRPVQRPGAFPQSQPSTFAHPPVQTPPGQLYASRQTYAQPQHGSFVQPGQPGMQAPFGSHNGVIGQAPTPQGGPAYSPPSYGGGAPQAPAPPRPPFPGFASASSQQPHAQPSHPGGEALQHQIAAAPQRYAFPTPNGMQHLASEGGNLAYAPAPPAPQYALPENFHAVPPQHAAPAPAPPVSSPSLRARIAALPARSGRARWEVAVPVAAVLCLLVAGGVFAANYDEITGGAQAPKQVTSTKDDGSALPPAGAEAPALNPEAIESEARELMRAGRYTDAARVLAPLLALPNPDGRIQQLAQVIDARGKRHDALLASVGKLRAEGKFIAALAALRDLEQMHPLSPALLQLRAELIKQQRTKARGSLTDRAFTDATAFLAAGRFDQALAVVDEALTSGSNARLEQLRDDIIAKRDAAASASRPNGNGAPPAGGAASDGTGSAGAPPSGATKPSGMPPVPDVPNTGGGGGDVNPGPTTTGGGGHSGHHTH